MAIAIPIEIFELLERKVGREDAKEVVKVIELTLKTIDKKAQEANRDLKGLTEDLALQKKVELRDELRNELITKVEFYGETKIIREEGKTLKTDLEGKIEALRIDLEGKIEALRIDLEGRIERINMKLNFLIILMIIALTLMNPVMAEIIKKLFKM